MPYKIVDASKAPAKPVKNSASKSAEYSREIILNLEPGKVAVVEPDDGQSQRGIKVSIGRVSSRMNRKVTSYSVDGDPNVYISLDDDQPESGAE